MPASGQGQSPRERNEAELRVGWKMAGLGMQVTSEVVAGALLGLFVDYLRGHGHTGVIVGSLVGISVGLYSLVSQALRLNRQLDRVAPTKGRGKPIPPSDDDSDSDFPKQ